MVSGIAHRGPDDRGLWSSPNGACVLGHARLSIVDLSPAGHQPMLDPITGNAIVFNGEIYNFQVLRKDCEAAGDVFRSHSDTEVILALYRRHGVGCLKFLRGMFAFAIWDEQRQQLFLARDRVGKKPLNYAVTKTGLAFCSELHPLSRHPGVDNGMDLEALELYLQCQFIPAPWTIYRGIRKLPPAHYAVYDRSGLKIEKYWEVDYRDKIRISEADALDALEEKLTEAVRLRMIADVPLGALLSGGVDSSVVVALMAKLSNEPVRTFSIGFEEEAFNELPWAQQAAERCGTLHHPEIVKGDVEHLLPKLARHYGEPYADASAVPSFFVSAVARRHVTVALNGDGGDELLGGYPRYWLPELGAALVRPARRMDAARAPRRHGAASPCRQEHSHARGEKTVDAICESRAAFGHHVRRILERPGAQRAVAGRLEVCCCGTGGVAGWKVPSPMPTTRSTECSGWTTIPTCPADLLVKMDIASMHCGLETRSPLLDHEVIEFCARLPVQYKVKDRVGKYLLKKLAERYFPAEFVHRPKMGFGIPLAAWLRGPLRKVLRETLLDAQLMAPLSAAVIERTLREFEAGGNEHESRLWALLMFGAGAASKRRT